MRFKILSMELIKYFCHYEFILFIVLDESSHFEFASFDESNEFYVYSGLIKC